MGFKYHYIFKLLFIITRLASAAEMKNQICKGFFKIRRHRGAANQHS